MQQTRAALGPLSLRALKNPPSVASSHAAAAPKTSCQPPAAACATARNVPVCGPRAATHSSPLPSHCSHPPLKAMHLTIATQPPGTYRSRSQGAAAAVGFTPAAAVLPPVALAFPPAAVAAGGWPSGLGVVSSLPITPRCVPGTSSRALHTRAAVPSAPEPPRAPYFSYQPRAYQHVERMYHKPPVSKARVVAKRSQALLQQPKYGRRGARFREAHADVIRVNAATLKDGAY